MRARDRRRDFSAGDHSSQREPGLPPRSNEARLFFEVQPDTVRIQCVPQNGGEVETITGILPYDRGYAFDLKSGSFVYRVIAEWDDGNRVEYGFIGKWL